MLLGATGGCHLIGGADEYTVVDAGGAGGTGTAGAGGMPACELPDQCPGEDGDCGWRSCEAESCGRELAVEGTLCSDDGGIVCDGDGACVACLMPDCAPYICRPDGLGCLTSCGGEGECVDHYYCDLLSGSCVDELAAGDACARDNQCASGFCADSTCCDDACDGSCNACDLPGFEGSCTLLPWGASGEGSCAPFVCDGVGAACPTSCGDELDCTSGNYCDASSACVPDGDLGDACTEDHECQSGHCADDMCCNTGCIQPCDACDMAGSEGWCTPKLDGSDDRACDPYLCNGAIVTCPSFCTVSADCAPDHYCSGLACLPKKPNGDGCVDDGECDNGHCSRDICCDAACTEPCQDCDLPMFEGTCLTAPDMSLGEPSCTPYVCDGTSTTCPSSCLGNGDCTPGNTCDATFHCAGKLANGGACTDGPSECQSGLCVEGFCCDAPCAGACDSCALPGSEGTCWPRPDGFAGDPGCGLYLCNGSGAFCPGSCVDSADCVSTAFCGGGNTCALKLGIGAACTAGIQCDNGACVDDFCCASACGGTCEACDGSGTAGSCTPSAAGTDPATECGGGVCDGARACAAGDYGWLVHFGNAMNDTYAEDVAVDPTNGDVVVVGRFKGTVDFGGGATASAGAKYDAFVVKYDASGTFLWSKVMGNGVQDQFAQAVAVSSAGDTLVVGRYRATVNFGGGAVASMDPARWDGFAVQYDAAGAFGWLHTFGTGALDQFAEDVAVDPAGNAGVVGRFRGTIDFGGGNVVSAGAKYDVFTVSYDATGSYRWLATAGNGSNDEYGEAVTMDALGNVAVAGRFRGTVDFGGGDVTPAGANHDAFIVVYDDTGAYQWLRTIGNSTATQYGEGLAFDALGNVVVIGEFQGPIDFGGGIVTPAGANLDVFVVSYDAAGAYRYARTAGAATLDQFGLSVAVDAVGSALAVGQFKGTVDFGGGGLPSVGAHYDAFAAKYDALGAYLWAHHHGNGLKDAFGAGVAIGPAGNVLVMGRFQGTVDFGGGSVSSAGAKDEAFILSLSP